MYILTQNETAVINSDAFGLFSARQDHDIYDKEGGYVILASAGPEAKPVRLAKYRKRGEAVDALKSLYIALSSGDDYFDMPEPEDDDE